MGELERGIFSIVVGVTIAFCALWIHGRIRRWELDRAIKKLMANPDAPRKPLYPECLTVVEISDSGVRCTHRNGDVEQVTWDELRKIEIRTTDEGPMLCDVFWILHGANNGCCIPQGATGEKELVVKMQALPGFQNEPLIDAMCCTDNQTFLCWERK